MKNKFFKPLLTTAVALGLISCMSLSACADEPNPTSDATIPQSKTVSSTTTGTMPKSDFFITTDKESYAVNEDIKVSVTYNNSRGTLEHGILLSATLDDGMTLKSGKTQEWKSALKTDESMSLDFVAVISNGTNNNGADNNNNNNNGADNHNNSNNGIDNNNSNGGSNVNTNTNNNGNTNTSANTIEANGKTVETGSELYGVIALSVTLVVMFGLIVALRKNKKAVRMMSMLLCAGMILSVSAVSFSAKESVVGDTLLHTSKTITVDGKSYTIHAYLQIGTSEQPVIDPATKVPDNFNEVIYSSNIAEYNGTIYCTRDVPNSGFVTVPTNLSEEIANYTGTYIYHPFGIAFYNDRLYISYKHGGSSNGSSKLYSCNIDGSDKIELASNIYDDINNNNPDRSSYVDFIIYKGVLYSNGGEFKLVIDDNADTTPDIDIKETLYRYTYYTSPYHYYDSEHRFVYSNGIYYIERKDSSNTNTFVIEKNNTTKRVTLPIPSGKIYIYDGALDSIQRITDTKAYVTGYGGDSIGYLYEIDINTGDYKLIDSHGTAGGGDAYFNW